MDHILSYISSEIDIAFYNSNEKTISDYFLSTACLVAPTQGQLSLKVNDQFFELKSPQLILIPPRKAHKYLGNFWPPRFFAQIMNPKHALNQNLSAVKIIKLEASLLKQAQFILTAPKDLEAQLEDFSLRLLQTSFH